MSKEIYNLRNDGNHVAQVQHATLHRPDAGLVSEQGLFGSDEWWASIQAGKIPVYSITGTITRVYMSGHNDYPEFEIDDGHSIISWTRLGADSEYIVGRTVIIDYVLQRYKDNPDKKLNKKLKKILGEHSKCVLRVSVKEKNGT